MLDGSTNLIFFLQLLLPYDLDFGTLACYPQAVAVS